MQNNVIGDWLRDLFEAAGNSSSDPTKFEQLKLLIAARTIGHFPLFVLSFTKSDW